MNCEICGGGCAEDSNPKVNMLTRINQKGVTGVWRCESHLNPFVRIDSNDQVEPSLDLKEAHFVHSPDCGGYCDYACNSAGFDQARYSNPLVVDKHEKGAGV